MSRISATYRLQRIFDLRPGEGMPLFFFFFHSLFLGLFITAFFSAANVLFLKRFEIDMLPYAYVLSGVLGLVVGSIFGFLQRHLRFVALMTVTMVALMAVTVLFRLELARSDSEVIPFLIFASVLPMVTLLQLEFWGLANRFFNLEQGKRLFGLVSSGDVVSSIIGFLALVHIIRWVGGVPNLLWLAALGLAGCLLMFLWIVVAYREEVTSEGIRSVEELEKPPSKGWLRDLLRDRYLSLMYAVGAASILGLFFVDFAFMGEIRANFGTGEALARFIGIFFGLAKILELIFKAAISGRALRQYGMKLGLNALPAGLVPPVLLAAVATFFLSTTDLASLESGAPGMVQSGFWASIFFVMVAIAKLVDRLARKSIEDPAFKLLFLPMPKDQRLQAQSSAELVRQGAQALAGGVLIVLVTFGFGRPTVAIWITAPLIAGWLFLAGRLYRAYRVKVVGTLSGHGRAALAQTLLEQWVDEMKEADPFEVSHSLRLLQRVAPALVQPLAERLRRQGNAEVRGAVDESLDFLRSSQMGQLGGIGKLSERDPAEIAEELLQLAESEEPRERIRAARTVSLVGDIGGTGILTALLGDRDPEVVRAALEASLRVTDSDLHDRIVGLLFRPEICGVAASTLMQLGEPILPLLERLFRRRDTSTVVLLRALRIYGQIGGEKAHRLLFDKLNHDEIGVRDEALLALSSSHFRARPADQAFVASRLDEVIEQIAWLLAGIVDLVDKPGFERLEAALRRELAHHQLQIFLYLSLLYDHEAIELVKDHYDSGSPDGRAFALEIVDVIVSPQLKDKLSPLIEDVTEWQRLRRLENEFPQERMAPVERARDILTVGYSRVDRWTRIQALRALIEGQDSPSDELLANLYNPDRMTREQAARAVLAKNAELFRSLHSKMAPTDRDELSHFLEIGREGAPESGARLSIFEKTKILQSGQVFSGVPAPALIRLAEQAVERILEEGEVLFEKGDPPENIYIVVEGELGVYDNGREINREVEGDIVGEIAVVEVSARSAEVKAIRETRLLEIAGESLFNLMADRMEVIHTILGVIARRRQRSRKFAEAS